MDAAETAAAPAGASHKSRKWLDGGKLVVRISREMAAGLASGREVRFAPSAGNVVVRVADEPPFGTAAELGSWARLRPPTPPSIEEWRAAALARLDEIGAGKSSLAAELRAAPIVVPEWRALADADDWLGAAKAAARDSFAPSGMALTCATIALTEAMARG